MYPIVKKEGKAEFLVHVNSSWIADLFYNFDCKVLTMVTHKDNSYMYKNVPLFVWEDLKEIHEDGGSIGSYFVHNVKNKYDLL